MVFDKILSGELPAEIVYENQHVLAFKDINPQSPQHVLVIPKNKARDFAELAQGDPTRIGLYFQGVARTARALGLEEQGYRIVLNCGRHGQQSVDYLHAHILGGRQLTWPPG